jgi:hypothetical protein
MSGTPYAPNGELDFKPDFVDKDVSTRAKIKA